MIWKCLLLLFVAVVLVNLIALRWAAFIKRNDEHETMLINKMEE